MATDRPRVAPIEPGTRPELAALEAQIMGARGRIPPLYRMLLHSAPVAHGWEQLLTAIRGKTTVPPALRELVILRVALLNHAAYEFEAHLPHAREAGLGEARIGELKNNDLEHFGELERLVLEYTDELTRHVEVSDALFARLRERFDATALVELTATIAAYNMVSRFLVALGIAAAAGPGRG